MSRTLRKDKLDRVYYDGKKRWKNKGRRIQKIGYYCNCFWCVGTTKEKINLLKEKVANREIQEYSSIG